MINARILVRKGLRAEFDPTKMLPGEWAVSIDASTSNQIVWMCFAPGVCKRMGTYEDFQNMVYNATGQIIERYEDAFGSILEEVNTNAEAVSANTDIVLVAKSDIINTYLPQIKSYVSNASASASEAKTYSENAKASASEADKSAEDAKKYSQSAFSTTPAGYEVLVGDVDLLKNAIVQTSERNLYGSKAGGIKLIGIGGASEQGENPNPDYPQEIESVGDSGSLGIKAEGKNKFTGWVANEMVNPDNGSFYASTGRYRTDYIPVESSQRYTLSGLNTDAYGFVAFYDSNKNFLNRTGAGTNWSLNSERTADCAYIVLSVYENKDNSPNFEVEDLSNEVQIEEGTEATPYEPYRSKSIAIPLNEPLRKGDEIAVVDGVWGVLHGKGKEVVDENTDITVSGASNGRYRITVTALYGKVAKASSNEIAEDLMCTHYGAIPASETYNGTQGIGLSTGGNIMIFDNKFTTADISLYKAWLAENPIEILYPLATPTFEPFADQTPFYGLESFDTVTYISTDSEVEPSIELKFAKTEGDAVTLLNYNQTNLNRIAIAELTSAVLALNQE